MMKIMEKMSGDEDYSGKKALQQRWGTCVLEEEEEGDLLSLQCNGNSLTRAMLVHSAHLASSLF